MDGDRQVELLGEALGRVADGTVLERVIGAAAPMLAATGVAAALISDADGSGVVVAASSPVAGALCDLTFSLGEGPARDGFTGDAEVLVDDLVRDGGGRWPAFTAAAQQLGAAAVYALPARLGAIRIGCLVVHREQPGRLDGTDLADARVLAELCSTLMVDHRAGLDSEALVTTGWPNRAVVHQATGMVATQLGTSLPTALARLRSYAFAQDQLLDDVARDVVERRLRLDP